MLVAQGLKVCPSCGNSSYSNMGPFYCPICGYGRDTYNKWSVEQIKLEEERLKGVFFPKKNIWEGRFYTVISVIFLYLLVPIFIIGTVTYIFNCLFPNQFWVILGLAAIGGWIMMIVISPLEKIR